MMDMLKKIAQLQSLGALLVLETCAEAGGTIELERFSVEEGENEQRTVRDGSGNVLATVHERDDLVSLQRDVHQSEELNAILGLVGAGKGGRGVAAGDWISVEELTDRTAAVEQAWQVLRLSRELASSEEGAMTLTSEVLTLARRWRLLRSEVCENENRRWVSRVALGRIASSEANLNRDLAAFHAAHETPEQTIRLVLESDPRGAALRLVARGRVHQEHFLMGLGLSWPMAADGDAAERTGGSRRKAATSAGRVVAAGKAQAGAPTSTEVAADVAAVLRESKCDGKALKLPGQLDKGLYSRVDAILKGMGAKWNRSAGAHVFKGEAAAAVASAVGSGRITTDKDWEFFATQPAEVARMLDKAQLRPGMKVLEPHGGEGAIALEAAKIVGMGNVHCFELMPRNAQTLAKLGFQVTEIDFLATQPTRSYDVILMNPPFANLADAAHIEHAEKWLKPGGKLVAISSTSWQQRSTEKAKAFRAWLEGMDAQVEPIAAGAFRQAGTDVPTLLITLTSGTPAARCVEVREHAAQACLFDEVA